MSVDDGSTPTCEECGGYNCSGYVCEGCYNELKRDRTALIERIKKIPNWSEDCPYKKEVLKLIKGL